MDTYATLRIDPRRHLSLVAAFFMVVAVLAVVAFAAEPAVADEEPPFSVSLYVKSDTTVPCDTEYGFGDCRIGIYGESVTAGTTLTFTAWETSAKTNLIDTIEETVADGASYSVGGGGYDPGNWVEVTDGTVTKGVEIPVHTAVIDARANTVSGHGEPAFAMAISVYPEDGTQQCGGSASPDGNGDWSKDFDDPEESGDPDAPACANTWDFGPGDWVIVASDGIIGFGDIKTVDVVPVFTDSEGTNFEADIIWLANEGITKGCNPPINDLFCPDDNVTRGQMAAFLVRALGYTDDGGGDLFTDDDGSIFEDAIDKLGAAGVTKGCNPPDNTLFCPDDNVTRGQMAAFLVRALGYTDDGGGDLFTDDDGSIFEDAIDKLGTAGVTKGCNPPDNTLFCPNANVTRGQMAAFLRRALG